jgi:transposase
MIFIGDDWAEDHHDVFVMDEAGRRLGSRRLPEGLAGIRQVHELIAEHAEEPDQVVVGIETDRGLWVEALAAAGYQVFAINPLAVSRYRDRHHVSGAKSDASDAKLLADLVRTDRHNHRPVAGDSANAEAIKVLARTHQNLIWTRTRIPTRCAMRCASTTQPRWWPSTTWPTATPSGCSIAPPPQRWAPIYR